MQNENYPQLSLDIAHVIEHANTLDEEPEKLRYLSQYSRLFAVYAEYEPFQVDALLSVLPENFQEEVWKLYNQELDVQFKKVTRKSIAHGLTSAKHGFGRAHQAP